MPCGPCQTVFNESPDLVAKYAPREDSRCFTICCPNLLFQFPMNVEGTDASVFTTDVTTIKDCDRKPKCKKDKKPKCKKQLAKQLSKHSTKYSVADY